MSMASNTVNQVVEPKPQTPRERWTNHLLKEHSREYPVGSVELQRMVFSMMTFVMSKWEKTPEYHTFSSFARSQGISPGHGRRLRQAEKARVNLNGPNVEPSCEWQTRSLTGLDKPQMVEAWKLAVKLAAGKQPTSNLVIYAVEHLRLTRSHKSDDTKKPVVVVPEVVAVIPAEVDTEVTASQTSDSTLARVPDAPTLMPKSITDGTQSQGESVPVAPTSGRVTFVGRLGGMLLRMSRK